MMQGFFIGVFRFSALRVAHACPHRSRYDVSLAPLDCFLVVYGLANLANIKKLTKVSSEKLVVFSLDHFEQSR